MAKPISGSSQSQPVRATTSSETMTERLVARSAV
jgi:hypothetical protein